MDEAYSHFIPKKKILGALTNAIKVLAYMKMNNS